MEITSPYGVRPFGIISLTPFKPRKLLNYELRLKVTHRDAVWLDFTVWVVMTLLELDYEIGGLPRIVVTKDLEVLLNAKQLVCIVFDLIAVRFKDRVEHACTLIFRDS